MGRRESNQSKRRPSRGSSSDSNLSQCKTPRQGASPKQPADISVSETIQNANSVLSGDHDGEANVSLSESSIQVSLGGDKNDTSSSAPKYPLILMS